MDDSARLDGRMEDSDGKFSATARRARQLLNQGASLLEQGAAGQAIPILEEAYALDGQSVPILISLGGAYIVSGQHPRAIPLLEMAKAVEPHNPMVWVNLGAAYLGNSVLAGPAQQTRAIAAFERALELDPAAPNVHYNLGLIFVDRGDTDLAVAAFRQATKINPLDRDARAWLGRLLTHAEGTHDV